MAETGKRRADLDALRVGALGVLIVFHVAKIYDPRLFQHYWSRDLIPGLDQVTAFFSIWHMPLLFLVAGWSALLSFQARGLGAFMRERLSRIVLPLFFGIVFLCPLLKFVELRSGVSLGIRGKGATAELQAAHGDLQAEVLRVVEPYTENFIAFLPKFYTSIKFFTWSHLWFLVYLLLITTLAAPLLKRLAGKPARQASSPWLWLIGPALVLALSETILRPHWPTSLALYNDWANVARYVLYFALGVVWARQEGLSKAARELWPLLLAAAAALYTLYLLLAGAGSAPGITGDFFRYGLRGATGWFVIVGLVGLAARFVTQGSAGLSALSASVLPVYIIHQPAIILSAFFLDGLALPVGIRFVLILLVSIALILGVVYGPAKRFAVLGAGLGHGSTPAATRNAAIVTFAFVALMVVVSRLV